MYVCEHASLNELMGVFFLECDKKNNNYIKRLCESIKSKYICRGLKNATTKWQKSKKPDKRSY